MNELVSIIIPIYNRADLIEQTLDSVLNQSYKNWECIVVDDGSTDNTLNVLNEFKGRDSRFKIFKRPLSKVKGANSCRNYGFQVSRGEYINWFDSDDIMLPLFIEKKVEVLKSNRVDYVLSKTFFFNKNDLSYKKKYDYKYDEYDITHYNYVAHRINWLTPDLMVKRNVVEGKIFFNEALMTTAQEYNFNCKLTLETIKGIVLNEELVGYRQHNESIESKLKESFQYHSLELSKAYYLTIVDLGNKINKDVEEFLYESIIRKSLDFKLNSKLLFVCAKYIFKRTNSMTVATYLIYQLLYFSVHKGHFLRKLFFKQFCYKTKWYK
jgi:glycosyltransferase involved in cell wall biosynthesis